MKKILLATTALVIAAPAFAAERPHSWSGCYVGGHFGVGRGKTTFSEPIEPGSQHFAPAGAPIGVADTSALGGIQGGCDLQFAQTWLAGVGAYLSFANIDGQTTDPFFTGKAGRPILLDSKTDRMGTLTGRLGYTWDRLLFYGKGGAAFAHDKYSIQNLSFFGNPTLTACAAGGPAPCNPSGRETRWGWAAGGGAEWVVANGWALGLEYAHYGFSNHSVQLTDPNGGGGPATGPVNVKQSIDAVKVSLNYRFLPFAP
jgi:outer membrane immunogenic protein